MEFMPILPLHDNDGENADDTSIPEELPLVPLRNTVLFPGVVIPITVGRDKSIKAVNEAYKTDKMVGVLAQKDSNTEDPQPEDLVSIGTVAKILKLIKMPDGGTTVIIQGKSRFKLEAVTSEDPYFRGKITTLAEDVVNNDTQFDATISSLRDLSAQIIQLSPNIPSEASIILKNIENASFLVHFISSNMNADLKEKQELLETNELRSRSEKLMHLLQV